MTNCFVGIDPGAKGAIAVLDSSGNVLLLEDMPYSAKEKELDVCKLVSTLLELKSPRCVLEKCQYTPAIKGSGAFTFGKIIGATETAIQLSGIPFELVRPQKWKKMFSLTSDKQQSITVAKKMFPMVAGQLLKSKDGRAEALLIAEYCRRTMGAAE